MLALVHVPCHKAHGVQLKICCQESRLLRGHAGCCTARRMDCSISGQAAGNCGAQQCAAARTPAPCCICAGGHVESLHLNHATRQKDAVARRCQAQAQLAADVSSPNQPAALPERLACNVQLVVHARRCNAVAALNQSTGLPVEIHTCLAKGRNRPAAGCQQRVRRVRGGRTAAPRRVW